MFAKYPFGKKDLNFLNIFYVYNSYNILLMYCKLYDEFKNPDNINDVFIESQYKEYSFWGVQRDKTIEFMEFLASYDLLIESVEKFYKLKIRK